MSDGFREKKGVGGQGGGKDKTVLPDTFIHLLIILLL